jgi:diacylglycerol kinase family enzyme
MLRARHILIESDPPLPVLIDGEVLGTTPVEFTLSPRALEVLAP